MKLVFFDDFKLGVIQDNQVVDVSNMVKDIPHTGPYNLINGLIQRFDQYKGHLEEAAHALQGTSLSQVRLRPPLPKPGKLICMAVNYMESGPDAKMPPINAFLKSPAAVIGPDDTIVLPEAPANIFEHEAELGLVIGQEASNVKATNWRDYVFGYINFLDVSARGLGAPRSDSTTGRPPMDSYFPIKSQLTFAPLGPYLVTADEIPDPDSLLVKLWVSGDLRQDYPTKDMAHKIPECIEWASWITTLEPGDVIATGTNHRGLGPLQDGDTVEMEIEELGKLNLKVRDDLKRQWPRETRAQREAREEAQAGKSS